LNPSKGTATKNRAHQNPDPDSFDHASASARTANSRNDSAQTASRTLERLFLQRPHIVVEVAEAVQRHKPVPAAPVCVQKIGFGVDAGNKRGNLAA
jgi:hypothetical protein